MLLHRRPLLLGAALAPLAAAAQPAWRPDRPIRAIVPFAPGGLADLQARIVSERAQQILGQPVTIENRTGGAAGLIGTDLAAKAPPDGYTILINSAAQAIAPALVARMPYDVMRDFAHVAVLGAAPMVLVCHPSVPARNLREFVALLKANPGKYNYAGAGNGSTVHLTGEVFRAAADVDIQFVHYRGGGPALQAVLSGESHFTGVSTAEAVGPAGNGSVRALVVGATQRSPVLPEVPHAVEAGTPGFQQDIWVVVAAPARTPPAIVSALNAAYNQAARQLEPRLNEMGLQLKPDVITPEQANDFIRGELGRYGAVLRAAGVQPE